MDIKNFLETVCSQIKYKPVRKGIAEELELHMEEVKEDYMCKGYSEIEAEEKAVKQMGEAEEIGKSLNKIHRPKLDWKLVILIVILICFGFLVALNRGFLTVADPDRVDDFMGMVLSATFGAYLFTLIIGILCGTIIYLTDYRQISKYSLQLYILATVLNIMAGILGVRLGGNVLWGLPIVNVSPIVFTIPMYVIAFAGFINNIETLDKKNAIKISLLAIFSIIILGITNFESAFVVAITYSIAATIQLAKLKKNKIKYIAGIWVVPIILLICFIAGIIIIPAVLNSEPYSETFIKAREIINSAKLFETVDSTNVNQSFFNINTNFALLSLLENYGWVVTIGMVVCVVLLNVKLIINATKIKDSYGKFLIISIANIFILETLFSLMMNLLGIPAEFSIPLVSYGKVSLIVNIMCLALVLSVYRRKDINLYEAKPKKARRIRIKIETYE